MLRKKAKKKVHKPSLWSAKNSELPSGSRPEHDFKGPNKRKKYRKPDEIYGDMPIPDSARKE
jgi:hypothetical protein